MRFFGTPPTTIDHRAHLCSERGTDGKAVAGRPDEILQQARETGKCLYILNICWCITVFWWESYYLFISFPLDLTEIIESLGVKAFRESTGNGNQKICDEYFAAMVFCLISSHSPNFKSVSHNYEKQVANESNAIQLKFGLALQQIIDVVSPPVTSWFNCQRKLGPWSWVIRVMDARWWIKVTVHWFECDLGSVASNALNTSLLPS